ncbi:MAG: 30S ribosomal protein S8 [Sulfurospirillum sp.]|nr:30S ribosomal protein S8 [Sulfurospirillum sp.]MBL0702798.1 30S ribosomal protein S8 [Sulfurospirillum sp.]
MINDLLADALTRIRNASLRKLDVTQLMHSKLVEAVMVVFKNKGYIESFNVIENSNKKFIKVILKYDKNEKSVITEIKKISKSGRRVYKGFDDIKKFKNGYGTFVVSTSKGVLSNDDAHKAKVGGEVLASIW